MLNWSFLDSFGSAGRERKSIGCAMNAAMPTRRLARDAGRGTMALLVSACWLAIVVVIVALLAGCAPVSPYFAGEDAVGFQYPADCKQDLSWVQAPIVRVPRWQLTDSHTFDALGDYNPKTGVIRIADDLSGWLYDDVVHHERCHIVADDWHAAQAPRVRRSGYSSGSSMPGGRNWP